ncbi:MAG: electron transfer flavoprotein subunit alpha/FixB family protein [Oscillospiraceae bacterium]
MKISCVVFPKELSLANSLIAAAPSGFSRELLVLGEAGDFDFKTLCFESILEILPQSVEDFREPLCCGAALFEYFSKNPSELIIFPAGVGGDDLAAHCAAELDCEGFLGALALRFSEGKILLEKPVYSNNLTATFSLETTPLVVSLVPASDFKAENPPEFQQISSFKTTAALPDFLTDFEYFPLENGDVLSKAKIILAAGRGVGKAENFGLLNQLSEKLGGALGGSRPTIYEGKLPPERLLGMSARPLAPPCCICFGVSGAAPFLAGVKKSQVLIAVNRDANAPIFDNCDLGIVADCNEFALALLKEI